MSKLYFVGFNGYQQCPKNQNLLPKVIADWVCIEEKEIINIYCTHRIVVIEIEEFFKIFGFLDFISYQNVQIIKKPTLVNKFASCNNFLIATSKTSLWKFSYKSLEWKELNLIFTNQGEKCIWEEIGNEILKLSFLQNHIVLLLNNGSVWKLSEENELHILYPYDLDKAMDISCGHEHCLILTESGCVLSYGNGSRGQLGNGNLNLANYPVQISALEGLKIIKIAAGGWHSCAITDSGDLCTWGWNNFGQLSAFSETEEVGLTALPVFVDFDMDSEIKAYDVACGSRHTIVKLGQESLYSAGWNSYSQLGIETSAEKVSKFTKAKIHVNKNMKLACGPWYTILFEKNSIN